MRKRLFPWLALLSLAACGGGAKSSASPGDDLEATPVATEAGTETEAVTEGGGDRGDDACALVCARVMACAVEISGQNPTDEQLTEAKQQCRAQCGEEDADGVEAAGQCAADNPGSCPGLIECVQAIQSGS